jgi:iron complex transport system ATP-binding protein
MLYVTHHFEEITPELFDNCLLLRNGQIYQSGPVEEMMRSEVISEFLKKPVDITQNHAGYYQLEFKR